jgi:hypothetical protein
MSSLRLLAVVLILALLAPPTVLTLPATVPDHFLVKNNSGERLRCRYRAGDGAWSEPFLLRPGAEFTRPKAQNDTLQFFCARPAKRVSYEIRPGDRNSMLRAQDGSIVMREITPDDDGQR